MESPWREIIQRWNKELKTPPLPVDHEHQFYKRLIKRNASKKRISYLSIAASLVVLLGFGFSLIFLNPPHDDDSIIKFQNAEFILKQNIEQQFISFEQLEFPESQRFINHGKEKLNRLQQDYKLLYSQWENNPNQPQYVPAMLENLNLQIELLQILHQELNQIKNTAYESL